VADVTSSVVDRTQPGVPTHDQVLDQVDLSIIATTADGTVVTWNARAEALFGWTRDEAIGRDVVDLIVPDEGRQTGEEVMATLQRGRAWQGPFRLRRKDGSSVTAFVKSSPIIDDSGTLIGIVGAAIEMGDEELARAVRTLVSDGNNVPRRSRTLSPREREVLALLARGLTGEQIAARLVLSPETVRTHIRNAREKLGASTRVEAVTMALIAREIQV
jgi:PAS domain S-box-containing protein